jgi:hypothetical protein
MSPTSVCWEPPTTKVMDELDQLIQESSNMFQSSAKRDEFVPKVRNARRDFHFKVGNVPHDVAHLLNRF